MSEEHAAALRALSDLVAAVESLNFAAIDTAIKTARTILRANKLQTENAATDLSAWPLDGIAI